MDGHAKQFVDHMRTLLLPKEALPYPERRQFLATQPTPYPEHFYHFRGYEGPNDERNLRDFLVHSRFFLRCPRDFNDPFECRFQFGALGTITDLYDRFVESATLQGTPRHIASSNASEVLLKIDPKVIAENAKKDTLSRFNALGIFCLCESYKDILMWGHYGQSHRGVCVEFDIAEGVRTFGLCLKVRYDNAMPVLDYPERSPRDLFNPIVRKSEHWRYEREWRIAIPSGSHQYIEFPPSAVKSVIYGCEATDATKKVVQDLLKDRASAGHAAVKERTLARSENTYELVEAP